MGVAAAITGSCQSLASPASQCVLLSSFSRELPGLWPQTGAAPRVPHVMRLPVLELSVYLVLFIYFFSASLTCRLPPWSCLDHVNQSITFPLATILILFFLESRGWYRRNIRTSLFGERNSLPIISSECGLANVPCFLTMIG